MTRTLATASCIAGSLLVSLLTGCAGGSTSVGGPSTSVGGPSTPGGGHEATAVDATSPQPGRATVATRSAGALGTVLVDGKGRTLYLFLADKKNKSTCTDGCTVAWPPLLTTGTAKAGKGADMKLLDIAHRFGGFQQVSYNGHPLYSFVGDTGPGQTKGQGLNQFGALWYVVNAKGKQVTS